MNLSFCWDGHLVRPFNFCFAYLNAATSINDLRVPPGNRLEKLVGDRLGQYSIRINNQWRICFVWTDENNAAQVEIVDYH